MRRLNKNSLRLLVLASGATLVPAHVLAADGPAASNAGTLEEIVVSGYRLSLERALDMKHLETSQVDAILAEDIGKFPDSNLAESLQRIPGVAITREGGEGREISVRGLGPQYTRTRINGMEATASVGAPDNDGGVNRTRAFDFNVFSSDLFTNLEVHKTSEGSVDEGSLGATIDLHSARPFDFKTDQFVFNSKADYNDLSKSTGPRLSFLGSSVNDDRTIGVLVSASYSSRKLLDEGYSTVRWDEAQVLSTGGTSTKPLVGFGSVAGTNCQVYPLPTACAAADSSFHPRFPRYDQYLEDQDRLGLSFALQFKPNENHESDLDVLHSYWGGHREERYIEAPGFSGTGACKSAATCTSVANIAVVQSTIGANNVMTSGTFNGVDIRTENRFDVLHTNFNQITFNQVDRWSNRFSTETLIGFNNSDFENPVQTTLGWDQYNVQGFSYAFSGTNNLPTLNFGNANLATGPWVLTEVRERPQSAINQFETIAETMHFNWSDNARLSAGASYKQFSFSTTSLRLVNGESVNSTNAYSSLLGVPVSSYGATYNTAGTTWYGPSVASAANALSLYSSSLFGLSNTADLGNNFSINEKDLGAFVQFDFTTNLFGKPLRGNVGIREVQTKQHSNGYSYVSSILSPVVADNQYNNSLPSLNLAYDVKENAVVRASASRVMARPDLTSLVGATSVSVSGTSYTVKTGNPKLEPFLADSYDLALEWYPSHGAIASVAGFRKNIITLVTSNTQNIPFTGNPYGIPDSAAVSACGSTPGCSAAATWSFSAPQNTSGGWVQGVEVNYQQPLSFLPGFLKHLGVIGNYTGANSQVNYPNGSGGFVQNQLTGLSRVTTNLTMYYEDDKWSIRLSDAYRSTYLSKIPGQEVGTNADGFLGSHNIDASIQYSVNQKLKLTLEGVNLSNQPEVEFDDTNMVMPYYVHWTGREYMAGFRYQF